MTEIPSELVYYAESPSVSLWNGQRSVEMVGRFFPDQRVLGYIHGLSNDPESACESAKIICDLAMGRAVFAFCSQQKAPFGDLVEYGLQKLHIETENDELVVNFLRSMLNVSHKPVILFAHSQGVLLAKKGLLKLPKEDQKRVILLAFGGSSFFEKDLFHPLSRHFISKNDPIPRMSFPKEMAFLLRLEEVKSYPDPAKELAYRDGENELHSRMLEHIELFAEKRALFYKKEIERFSHVEILDPSFTPFEHAFCSPCYLEKVACILNDLD